MVKSVFPFPVSKEYTVANKTYDMPVLICFQCSTVIRNFYNFSKQVEAVQTKLKNEWLSSDGSLPIDPLVQYVKEEPRLREDFDLEGDNEFLLMSADVEAPECESDTSSNLRRTSEKHFIEPFELRTDAEGRQGISSDPNGCVDKTEKRQRTSKEDRGKIISAYENGSTMIEIAQMLNLKRTTVQGIISRFLKTGLVEAAERQIPDTKKLSTEHVASLKMWNNEDCTVSFRKLAQKLREVHGVEVSVATVSRAIRGFNYTIKQVAKVPEQSVTQAALSERRAYADSFVNLPNDFGDDQIFYINEVGFNVSIRKGRSLRGQQTSRVPAVRSHNFSIACAMSKKGITHFMLRNRSINKDVFLEFLDGLIGKIDEQNLSRCLFVMDNVPFHRSIEVRYRIEDRGHQVMCLPPNCPFFNPNDNLFGKWKQIVKSANPQNEAELLRVINDASNLITRQDCEESVQHMWSNIRACINGEDTLS
uniref:Tc1-like transposase DDE domain-containing protein n=1 Tax=Anopheles atroparvus TaxID=41427 RepID=A0AAG5DWX4_ANOAO